MVATRSRRRCEVALFAATEGDSLRDFPGKQVDGKRQIPGECSKNYVFVRSPTHFSLPIFFKPDEDCRAEHSAAITAFRVMSKTGKLIFYHCLPCREPRKHELQRFACLKA